MSRKHIVSLPPLKHKHLRVFLYPKSKHQGGNDMPGTYRKRGKDSYLLEVCIGADFKGTANRYSKTVHCSSDREAEKELSRFFVECESGSISKASTITVGALCDLFFEEYAKLNLKKSSQLSIKTSIKVAIKPYFQDKKASKIKRLDIQQWINELYKGRADNVDLPRRAPKTIRNYYSAFRTILQFAVTFDIIPQNPCRDIVLPKKEHKEANYYDKSEVSMLINCLENTQNNDLKFKVAIYIALFGGLRKGEILGLNWEDVDWEKKEIKIRRTRMIERGHGVYEDTPKTDKSNRVISLPVEVIEVLQKLKLQQSKERIRLGTKWEESPAILKGEFGQPMYPQVLQRWFTRFLKENNLRNIGLHGLRHTHTSMLAYLQKDKLQISKRLGHSQLSTTLNIYTHLFEETDQSIAADLSAEFIKKKA